MGKYTISEGKSYEALPDDKYQVEIYAAEPFVGTEYQSQVPQDQVKFTFVILNDDKTVLEDGVQVPARGRRLWLQTTTIFSPVGFKKQTNLTLLAAAVYGHELEEKEVTAFDEKDLLGKQLCLMVGQKRRQDGSTGNKILSFSKAEKLLSKYDDSEFKASRQAAVKVSQGVGADPDSFEADMDKMAKEKAGQ